MRLKRLKVFGLLFLFLWLGTACKPQEVLYYEGTYEGIGEGHHGPIRVQIQTTPYEIKKILIVEEYEMPELAKIVYEKIPERVIKANHTDVDVVAGATYTSYGLLDAIEDGLSKAKVKK